MSLSSVSGYYGSARLFRAHPGSLGQERPRALRRHLVLISHSQHFQGLRRAQNKAESNGSGPGGDNPRKVDPTMNPITRRPGPGRGRPRKSQQQPGPVPGADTVPGQSQTPVPVPVPMQAQPPVQVMPPVPTPEPLAVDPSLEDPEESAAKRPRLEESQDPTLEDEAVLNALAAHNNPADHYAQE